MDWYPLHSVIDSQTSISTPWSITSVVCDPFEELVWVGSQSGRVTSYLQGRQLERYTSFLAHTQEVRQLAIFDGGIATITQDNMRVTSRQGLALSTIATEHMYDLQCMVQPQKNSSMIIVGGNQDHMIAIDAARGKIVREYTTEQGVGIMKHDRYLCCGGISNGLVTLRDANTMKAQHILDAHTGPICDMDVHGNMLATCGYGTRYGGMGELLLDPYVKIYDMRTMRVLELVQYPVGPFQCKFIPKYSGKLMIAAQSGILQVSDIGENGAVAGVEPAVYHIDTQGEFLTSMDISSSSEVLFVGDTGSLLQEWTCVHDFGNVKLNQYSRDVIFPEPAEPYPNISPRDNNTPLAIVPLPYTRGERPPSSSEIARHDLSSIYQTSSNESEAPSSAQEVVNIVTPLSLAYTYKAYDRNLLSTWPTPKCRIIRHPPVPIDPDILKSVEMRGFVGYAPNHGLKLRNQFPYSQRALQRLQEISGRPQKKSYNSGSGKGITSPPARKRSGYTKSEVPKHYRQVEIKYSRIGLENFDFGLYNKTAFSGLETHIPNAYCNAALQVLYFFAPAKECILNHICDKEFCLLCELGFLFWMLAIADGKNCQASNFLRALRTVPQASALGLILKDDEVVNPKKVNFSNIIQSFLRFVLQQIHQEFAENQLGRPTLKSSQSNSNGKGTGKGDRHNNSSSRGKEEKPQLTEPTPIQSIFAIPVIQRTLCQCNKEMLKFTAPFVFELFYPKPPFNTAKLTGHTFSSILKESICREQATKAWCDNCKKFQPSRQTKLLVGAPDVLCLNVCLNSDTDYEFWQLKNEEFQLKRHGSIYHMREKIPLFNGSEDMERPGDGGNKSDDEGLEQKDPLIDLDNYSSWIPNRLEISFDKEISVEDVLKPKQNFEEFGKDKFVIKEYFDEVDAQGTVKPSTFTASKEETKEFAYTYDLASSIAYIQDSKTGGNLVSCIKIDKCYAKEGSNSTGEQWYLFNDFSVSPISKNDALYFNARWKMPCCLFFVKRKEQNHPEHFNLKSNLSSEVLFTENPLARDFRRLKTAANDATFVPFSNDELPRKGDIFAIDAEFVALEREEAQIRCDGTRSTLKPSQMCLARVSVVRGQGALDGVPCIDDYIATNEHIVDYLTEFSGICPGDLDPAVSTKNLTTLKAVYMKLRYLVDQGCVFVGHGLKKDFRTINLLVPPSQVVDTVELFYLERQRRISLKFLAWFFLGIDIQTGNHDSIEDSHSALMLYKKYREFKENDCVEAKIREVYDAGRKFNWRAPHWPQVKK
eukprot:Nk52_evm30s1360 gene=Nk52_evmTU30s1360